MVNFKKYLVAAMFFPILAGAEVLPDRGATFSVSAPVFNSDSFEIENARAMKFWKENDEEHPGDEIFVMKDADGGIIVSAGGNKRKAMISLEQEEYSNSRELSSRTNVRIDLVPCEKDCGENIVGREKNDYSVVQKIDRIAMPLFFVVDMYEPRNSAKSRYRIVFSKYDEKPRTAKITKLSENSIKISIK